MCRIDKKRANFMKKKRGETRCVKNRTKARESIGSMRNDILAAIACFSTKGVLYSLQNERLSGIGENE